MKKFAPLKAIMLLATASIAFAAPALAYDGHHHHRHHNQGKDVVIGIIGQVIDHAIEQEDQKKWERQCRRWYNRCEDGDDYACDKYDYRCE